MLDTFILGYSPLLDAQRTLLGTRLTLFPARPDLPVDGTALLECLAQTWPGPAGKATGAGVAPGTVALNVAGEGLLRSLLSAPAKPPFVIEVPSFLLGDSAWAEALVAWHGQGGGLWLKARQVNDLAPEWRARFSHCVFDLPDAPPAGRGTMGAVAAGARVQADLDALPRQGAIAAAGWPLHDPLPAASATRKKVAPEIQVVMELIQQIDREEPIDRMENTLKRDPTLAFRLLRYMNSAAFGLSVEVSSFRHALMILGYARLKRWLALLLASASKNPAMKPVMAAALRRGLLMEELARSSGDAEMRGEMFICGVFSLLDHMLEQPFDELLKSVPVPERVQLALTGGQGPFVPALELVRAIEGGEAYEVRERAEAAMLDLAEVNRATLAALAAARQLD